MPDVAHLSRDDRGDGRARLLSFPARSSHDTQRGNLPVQLSSFVGRERERTEIARLLEDHRLLTLTESGGSGKTRLAFASAGGVVEGIDGSTWIFELAPAGPSAWPTWGQRATVEAADDERAIELRSRNWKE